MTTSTNEDPRYLLSNYLPNIIVNDPDADNQNPQIEVFSSVFIKTLNLLESAGYYQYYREHVPVIARRQLGNTSCWWAIIALSKQMHPLLIEPGELLSIPNIVKVKTALEVQNNNASRIPRFRTI